MATFRCEKCNTALVGPQERLAGLCHNCQWQPEPERSLAVECHLDAYANDLDGAKVVLEHIKAAVDRHIVHMDDIDIPTLLDEVFGSIHQQYGLFGYRAWLEDGSAYAKIHAILDVHIQANVDRRRRIEEVGTERYLLEQIFGRKED